MDQSNSEWNSIIYNVKKSFSSLLAYHLVRLDKQVFFGRCQDIFSGKDGSIPLEKIGTYAHAFSSHTIQQSYTSP